MSCLGSSVALCFGYALSIRMLSLNASLSDCDWAPVWLSPSVLTTRKSLSVRNFLLVIRSHMSVCTIGLGWPGVNFVTYYASQHLSWLFSLRAACATGSCCARPIGIYNLQVYMLFFIGFLCPALKIPEWSP